MTEHVRAQADGGDLPVGGFLQSLGQFPAGATVAEGHQVQGAGTAAGFFRRGNKDFARQRASAALVLAVGDEVHGDGPYRLGNGYVNTFSVLYRTCSVLDHLHMDASTARTLNIRELVTRYGGPARFSNTFGAGSWSPAQVSQWISKSAPKGIGNAIARRIEKELSLPPGYMDIVHSDAPEVTQPLRVEEPRATYSDPDEAVLLALFRRMPKRKKRAILDLMNSESPPAEK